MRIKPLPEAFAYGIDIGKKVFHVVVVQGTQPMFDLKRSRNGSSGDQLLTVNRLMPTPETKFTSLTDQSPDIVPSTWLLA